MKHSFIEGITAIDNMVGQIMVVLVIMIIYGLFLELR